MIKKYIEEHAGEIFDAGYLYEKFFQLIPNKTYLKIIERFVDEGGFQRISKGVYLIGQQKDDIDPILEFYTSNFSGMIIGNRMYYELGLIDSPGEEIELLTSKITTSTKNINNYKLRYVDMFFTQGMIEVIQGLECIAQFSGLEEVDQLKLFVVIEKMIESYKDPSFRIITQNMKYDYATIKTLAKLLNEQNIANNAIEIYEELTK